MTTQSVPHRRRLLLWPLAAALVGVVAGVAVGWLTALAILPTVDPQATFGDLGAYAMGAVVGVGVAVVVWLVGLARAARRLFVPGRRLGVVAASAGATFVAAVVAGGLANALADVALGDGLSSLGALAGLLLVVLAPSGVFLLWSGRAGTTAGSTPQP